MNMNLKGILTIEEINIDELSENLLEYLLTSNPVTNLSCEIKTYIKDKIGTRLNSELCEEMKVILSSSNYIDLDGFINFRLPYYAHEINLILYAIVKNSLYKY